MEHLFVIDLKDYDVNWPCSKRPSVRAIIQKGDKLAMVYDQKYDYYTFPGGGIEEGETFHQALVREVEEEVGLLVIPESIEEFGSALRRGSSYRFEKTIFEQENFYYTCKTYERIVEQKLDEGEAEEGYTLVWVSPEEAWRKNRFDDHKEENGGVWIERETRILEIIVKIGCRSV